MSFKLLKHIFSIKQIEEDDVAGFIKYKKVIRCCFLKFKTTKYRSCTKNNKVFIGKKPVTHYNQIKRFGQIKINGDHNTIRLPDTNNLTCRIEINGENNKVSIGNTKRPSYVWIAFEKSNHDREVRIGSTELIGNIHCRIIDSHRKIVIGDNCLFSYGIYIWTTDSHAIYDLNTRKRLNEDKDIIIGDNVWVGRNVSINKGAIIPNGCIVGANAFVNKAFDESNCILAGTPAKVVKRNVYWDYNEDKTSTQFVVDPN